MITKIKNNYKVYILYTLIGLAIVFAAAVFIIKPSKMQTLSLNDGINFSRKKLSFPYQQTININEDKLVALYIYLGDDSLNKYDYKVLLKDNDRILYERDYHNNLTNILYLGLDMIDDSKNKNFDLQIICDDCHDVYADVGKLKNDNSTSLKIFSVNFVRQYNYYWYSLLVIVFCLTLLPLAKEDE